MVTTTPRTGPAPEVPDVRGRIVNAALDLFAAKGYAAASLREIAEAARTTKPMIYYYFQSKEGLYASTLGERLQAFADAIDRATQRDDDPRDRLRAFSDAYLTYFQSQEPHLAFVVREVFGLGAQIMAEFGRNLDQHVSGRLRRILEDGMERGVFRRADPDACVVAVMGILSMFILRRVFGGETLDREAAVAQVVDFYVPGLGVR